VPAGEPGTKPRVIAALGGRALRRSAQRQGLRTRATCWGCMTSRATRRATGPCWPAGWRARIEGDVIMCHAALPDDSTGHDPIAMARATEYGVLRSELPALLAAAGCRPAPLLR
jgi:hypothetical protein